MITQRDSQVMTGLGEAAKVDSGAMKTIAVVTMASCRRRSYQSASLGTCHEMLMQSGRSSA